MTDIKSSLLGLHVLRSPLELLIITLSNHEVSGDFGKGSFHPVWPFPRCSPPQLTPHLHYGEAPRSTLQSPWKAGEELITKDRPKRRFRPLCDASHPLCFPVLQSDTQKYLCMFSRWEPNRKDGGEKRRDLLMGPEQRSSVTHRFFPAPFPSLCFPVLPSLSILLCGTFLLAPLSTLFSLKCCERLFYSEGQRERGDGHCIAGRGEGGRGITELVGIQKLSVWKC